LLAPEYPSGDAQPWLCKPDRAHVQAWQELEITTHLWLGAEVWVLRFYVAVFFGSDGKEAFSSLMLE